MVTKEMCDEYMSSYVKSYESYLCSTQQCKSNDTTKIRHIARSQTYEIDHTNNLLAEKNRTLVRSKESQLRYHIDEKLLALVIRKTQS